MTLDTLIMLAGGFVAVLPFLQLPLSWIAALSFITGIIIVGLGVVVRRKGQHLRIDQKPSEHFIDASPEIREDASL